MGKKKHQESSSSANPVGCATRASDATGDVCVPKVWGQGCGDRAVSVAVGTGLWRQGCGDRAVSMAVGTGPKREVSASQGQKQLPLELPP